MTDNVEVETQSVTDEVVTEQESKTSENQIPERFKEDLHKYKSKARDYEKKVEELNAKLSEIQEQSLAEKEDYKGLYEKVKMEKKALEEKFVNTNKTFIETQKMNKVKEIALQNGIKQEALEDLDLFALDDVLIETTNTGKMSVVGADDFVSRLKESRPYWFKTSSGPRVDNTTGDYKPESSGYTPKDLLKIQKENPDKYRDIMQNKKHLIRR